MVTQPPGLANVLNQFSTFRWGAHHPDCSFHDHHILRILGRPLCLGCVCLCTGATMGLIFLWILPIQNFSWPMITMIGLGMAPLPYFQMHFQQKWFKIFARTGLGIGSVLFIGGPLFFASINWQGVLVRVLTIGIYVLLVRHALARRQRTMNEPCNGCIEGVFPLCSWNKDKIIAASTNPRLDQEGREFLQMVAQSVCVPPDERMVTMLSASDFDGPAP